MPNLGIILIFAALAASPSPAPSPTAPPPDPCGSLTTNLLATLDRPSIGFSPCAVKLHETVLEAGYANVIGTQSPPLPTYPQGFLRFGAAPNFEADVIASGRLDSGFGAKVEWWHDGSRAFATDFLYIFPTGAAGLTAGAPIQTLNFDYAMPLSSRFGLATTLGAGSAYAAGLHGASGRFFSLLPSMVISDQWNPRAQAFIEAFGASRTRPDGGALFGADVAFQYLLAPGLEIDVEAAQTADDVMRTHSVGIGFGARF